MLLSKSVYDPETILHQAWRLFVQMANNKLNLA